MTVRVIVTILSITLVILVGLSSCTGANPAPITFFTTPFSPLTTPTSPLPTTTNVLPTTTNPTGQHIELTMAGIGIWGGYNSGVFCTEAWYTKVLNAGDKVSGFVELTGQYHSMDWSYEWYFRVLDPSGKKVIDQTYVFDSNMAKNHYNFSFTASSYGTYKIVVIHLSDYSRNLVIDIQPMGWEES